jgi:hypothetical protein
VRFWGAHLLALFLNADLPEHHLTLLKGRHQGGDGRRTVDLDRSAETSIAEKLLHCNKFALK